MIWRIVANTSGDGVVLEIREAEKKEVTIVWINLQSGHQRILDLPPELNWKTSILQSHEDTLFLTRIEQEEAPGPGTLFVYDIAKGKIEKVFDQFVSSEVSSNRISGTYQDANGINRTVQIDLTSPQEPVRYPALYPDTSPVFELVTTLLNTWGIHPVRAVDYLEYKASIIFTYYCHTSTGLERNLCWIHDEKLCLNTRIDTSMKGIAGDSFIVTQKNLIFVSDRDTLITYAL